MSSDSTTGATTGRTDIRAAFHTVMILLGGFLALSALTLVAAALLLAADPAAVTPAVWVRGTIVVVCALVSLLFARGAARGSARAYLRLRIVTALWVVAIAAIIAGAFGPFPLWMKLEQGVCGLLLLAVVVIINTRRTRSLFTAR